MRKRKRTVHVLEPPVVRASGVASVSHDDQADGKHVKRWRTIQKVVAELGRQLAQLLGDGIEALLLLALW